MKRSAIFLILFALLLSSLACGLGGGDKIEIKVVNKSPYDVCYAQISLESEETWGEDQLGDEEVIEPGDTKTFKMDAGTYDVLLRDCDAIPVKAAAEISSDTTITIGGPGMVGLALDNQSSDTICGVYISPSNLDEWGEDWLGAAEDVLAGDQRIFFIEPGVYDLLAQDCEGAELAVEVEADLIEDWMTWTLSDGDG